MSRRSAAAALDVMTDRDEHVLQTATDRFERRLAEENGKLRIQMADGFGELRQQMASGFGSLRAEMIDRNHELLKWVLVFLAMQLAATAAILTLLR